MSRKQFFGEIGNNYFTVNVTVEAYNMTWASEDSSIHLAQMNH